MRSARVCIEPPSAMKCVPTQTEYVHRAHAVISSYFSLSANRNRLQFIIIVNPHSWIDFCLHIARLRHILTIWSVPVPHHVRLSLLLDRFDGGGGARCFIHTTHPTPKTFPPTVLACVRWRTTFTWYRGVRCRKASSRRVGCRSGVAVPPLSALCRCYWNARVLSENI